MVVVLTSYNGEIIGDATAKTKKASRGAKPKWQAKTIHEQPANLLSVAAMPDASKAFLHIPTDTCVQFNACVQLSARVLTPRWVLPGGVGAW